jgi:FAD:protein FMN transferase
MGMPITLEVIDRKVEQKHLAQIFDYFAAIDEIFSTYKSSSEISKINRGELLEVHYSPALKTILALSEQTREETQGYFDIRTANGYDPSGLVKGWALQNATRLLKEKGLRDFSLEAGGDIQVCGRKNGNLWRVGVRNPFKRAEQVKILELTERGVATSGTAIRGQHIYDPHDRTRQILDIVSLTVIGPNIYEADRFATAAFAMGRAGLTFIEDLPGFEGYMIDSERRATLTSGFERYVALT